MDFLLTGAALMLVVALLSRRRRALPRPLDARPGPAADASDSERLATLATRHQVLKDIQSHFEGHHVDEA